MHESRPSRTAPATQPAVKFRRGRGPRKPQEWTGLQASIIGLNGMLDTWRANLPLPSTSTSSRSAR